MYDFFNTLQREVEAAVASEDLNIGSSEAEVDVEVGGEEEGNDDEEGDDSDLIEDFGDEPEKTKVKVERTFQGNTHEDGSVGETHGTLFQKKNTDAREWKPLNLPRGTSIFEQRREAYLKGKEDIQMSLDGMYKLLFVTKFNFDSFLMKK